MMFFFILTFSAILFQKKIRVVPYRFHGEELGELQDEFKKKGMNWNKAFLLSDFIDKIEKKV